MNEVVPDDRLDEVAMAFAHRLAAGAPLAVQYTKQAVNALVKDAMNTSFDQATALEIETFRSADHQEALAALREGPGAAPRGGDVDLYEALLTTRAMRRFTDEPVDEEDVRAILRAAVQPRAGATSSPTASSW